MSNMERARMIVCLNKGIIPIDLNVVTELSKMDPMEARKAKRKFRKLRRKAERELQHLKFRSHRKQKAREQVRKAIQEEASVLLKGIPAISDM